MKDIKGKFSALADIFAAKMKEEGVPGAVLGLEFEGERFIQPFGVTNVEHPTPVGEDTLFQVGSITKTFTALALLLLLDEGKIDLDAPVRIYLPDFTVADSEVSASVTVRDLLTHTAGWVGDIFLEIDDDSTALKSYVEAIGDVKQVIEPGRLFSYNNTAFSVAGRIIEVLTDRIYEDVIQEWVFDPLGMGESFFFASDIITRHFSVGHMRADGGFVVARPYEIPRTSISAGGVAAPAGDLLTYAASYFEGGTLLDEGSKSEMLTPQFKISGNDRIGLSWFIHDKGGVKLIEHAGGTLGQVAQLTLAPDHGFTIVVLANAYEARPVIRELEAAAFESFLGITEEESDFNPASVAGDRFLGRFAHPTVEIDVYEEGGEIFARILQKPELPTETEETPSQTFAVEVSGPDQLRFTEGRLRGAALDFIALDGDAFDWVRMNSRIHKRKID